MDNWLLNQPSSATGFSVTQSRIFAKILIGHPKFSSGRETWKTTTLWYGFMQHHWWHATRVPGPFWDLLWYTQASLSYKHIIYLLRWVDPELWACPGVLKVVIKILFISETSDREPPWQSARLHAEHGCDLWVINRGFHDNTTSNMNTLVPTMPRHVMEINHTLMYPPIVAARPRGHLYKRGSRIKNWSSAMAVYDPDEVVIPNKLWMGDVRVAYTLFLQLTSPLLIIIAAGTLHGWNFSQSSLCPLWLPFGGHKMGAGQTDWVSWHLLITCLGDRCIVLYTQEL